MKMDRYLHIFRFLHFPDNNNEPDITEENSVGLRKMRNLFEILNKVFSKFYSFSAQPAVDEVIALFKGCVAFRQYIAKKHKRFGIKIYRLCDETEYTYHMPVLYLMGVREYHIQILDSST